VKKPATGIDLRHRAELRLRQRSVTGTRVESHAETRRMLHEIQVHQIELELQNEELQQAKAEVDANLEKYTDLYDFAPVGFFSIDEAGLILDVNLTGSALLGMERSRLIKRRFQLFMTPQKRAEFALFLKRIFKGHKKHVCQTSLLRTDRPAFWADLQAMSAGTGASARKWCRVAVIDVSARKQAEEAQRRVDELAAKNRDLESEIVHRHGAEVLLKKNEQRALQSLTEAEELQAQLRLMAHQLLMVEQNQRKQISRELHDKICQLLLGINLHLAIFSKTAASDPKGISKTLAPLRRLVVNGVKIVHRFARDLRPSALDDLGLIPALRSYIGDFPKRKGREIRLAAFAEGEVLDSDKRTVLYRVVQEALVNAAKHARATLITVSVFEAADGVRLEITDNGRGFAMNRHASTSGSKRLGMVGMRERVEMVGGRLVVESAPGRGTTVRAVLA
jgi:PAS domain S-box-containing protein